MKTTVAFVTLLFVLTSSAYADESFQLRAPELNAKRMKNVGLGITLAGYVLATAGTAPLAIGWSGDYSPATQRSFDIGASFVGIGVVAGALGSILWIAGAAREHRALGRGVGVSSNGSVVVRF